MNTSIKISMFVILLVAFFVRARYSESTREAYTGDQVGIAFPTDVKAVIDNKCYGCHSVDGKSDDAKKSLMWDSIPLYGKARQISVLDDISEVLKKGEMPPEKFIEMHPEAALTPDQVKLLKSWAETTADNLMK